MKQSRFEGIIPKLIASIPMIKAMYLIFINPFDNFESKDNDELESSGWVLKYSNGMNVWLDYRDFNFDTHRASNDITREEICSTETIKRVMM